MNGPVFLSVCFLLSITAFSQSANALKIDYYWREYTGEVPEDAVPGGLDKNNKTTYIGQVLVLKEPNINGILPVTIYRGSKVVMAEFRGVHAQENFIKILCSPTLENFEWVNANYTNLHLVTIGRHLVPGGVQNGNIVNIGRIQFQGELVIGKVHGAYPNNALMYFPYNNETKVTQTYQVLTYRDDAANRT